MVEIIGTVGGINQKDKVYGIILDNNKWYNGKGQCPVSKGDSVKISYTQNGTFNNIDSIETVSGSNDDREIKPASIPDDRTKDIHFQVCIKEAGSIVNSHMASYVDVKNPDDKLVAESIVSLARAIQKEAWDE